MARKVIMLTNFCFSLFHLKDILIRIKEIYAVANSPSKFWLGPRLCILINKPEQVEKVLNHPGCLDKGNLYDFVAEAIGNGLVTLRGEGTDRTS